MRRFLYFLPGVPGANNQMLSERGLLSRFRRFGGEMMEHSMSECLNGPGGRSGCIVAAGPGGAEYKVTGQRWLEGEKFWTGVEDANFPPRPGDLEREVGIAGYEMKLGDGNMWRVPLIHAWKQDLAMHVPNLPQIMVPVINNGVSKMAVRVQPEFAAVDEIARRVFESFAAGATVSLEKLFADAAAILNVNYRVGPEECGLLGLLDEKRAARVLALSIDVPKIEAQAEALSTRGLEFAEPKIEPEEAEGVARG